MWTLVVLATALHVAQSSSCYSCINQNLYDNWYLTGFPTRPDVTSNDTCSGTPTTTKECDGPCLTFLLCDNGDHRDLYSFRGCRNDLNLPKLTNIPQNYCEFDGNFSRPISGSNDGHLLQAQFSVLYQICNTENCNTPTVSTTAFDNIPGKCQGDGVKTKATCYECEATDDDCRKEAVKCADKRYCLNSKAIAGKNTISVRKTCTDVNPFGIDQWCQDLDVPIITGEMTAAKGMLRTCYCRDQKHSDNVQWAITQPHQLAIAMWTSYVLFTISLHLVLAQTTKLCYSCVNQNLYDNWGLTGFPTLPDVKVDDNCNQITKATTNAKGSPCSGPCVQVLIVSATGNPVTYSFRGCRDALKLPELTSDSKNYCEFDQDFSHPIAYNSSGDIENKQFKVFQQFCDDSDYCNNMAVTADSFKTVPDCALKKSNEKKYSCYECEATDENCKSSGKDCDGKRYCLKSAVTVGKNTISVRKTCTDVNPFGRDEFCQDVDVPLIAGLMTSSIGKMRTCYCRDKDYCNGAPTASLAIAVAIPLLTFVLFKQELRYPYVAQGRCVVECTEDASRKHREQQRLLRCYAMASSSLGALTTSRFIRGAADRPTRLLRKTHAIDDEDEGISPSGIVNVTAGSSTVSDELCLQSAGIGDAASTSMLPSVSFLDAQTIPKPEPVRSCSGDEIMNIGGIDLITNSWLNFANVDSTGLQNIGGLGGFSIKQFSTESTTSTSSSTGGVGTALIPPDVPRKSVIQDDIRMNRGRFQLVRKKGRSEVWNLFGQVLDTLTGQRLPYVACYACKVLYTDTGGGTGNMTRHRCPMGTSYRSSLGTSSSETSEFNNNQSSFDSTHNPPNGSMSPDNVNQIKLHLGSENPTTSTYVFTETERQLFVQAVVRFCAQDMQNPDIVEGDGFRQLIETALCIGRSCLELPNYQQLRALIPSSVVVSEAIERNKSSAKKSTSADVAVSLKEYGLALSCRQIQYENSIFVSFWVNYITEDWHLSRRVLSVTKWPQSNDLSELINQTLDDYGFNEAKKIYITLDRFTQKNARIELSQQVIPATSIVDVIDEILAQVFMQCRATCDVDQLSGFCVRVIEMLARLNLLSLLPHKLPTSLTSQRVGGTQSYALFLYPLLIYVRQQFPQIQYFLEAHSDHNGSMAELANEANSIDWSQVNDIETFLEPFHETVQIFTDNKLPHYHRLFPEWFALIHECSEIEDDDITCADGTTACASKGSPFLVSLRYAANLLLKKWSDENMLVEHHMATVLNPRLKHLPVICSDVQRTSIYNHIRTLIGCAKLKKERSCDTPDGEPPRKRRHFLISLEDNSMDEDELGCYLRTSFSASQTKDILEFWSTVGEVQFPRLSRLARFLLASTAAAPTVQVQVNEGKLTEKNLHNLLLLRSAYGL